MAKKLVTDELWEVIEPLLPEGAQEEGYNPAHRSARHRVQ
jgi:transposase